MGDHEDASKREEGGGPGAPSFTDDFICVSEFSEIVGPVPLFCIPESGKGSFNIEKFVIRIMAVDYQNKSCDPGAFVDDTQVVITEPTENAFAYVHHFTLLDVFARGYVRPICMSYITRHPTKIMDNFSTLMKKFNKVSRIFKAGNQLVFLEDLKHRLADLYHTREILQQKKSRSSNNSSQQLLLSSTDSASSAAPTTTTSSDDFPAVTTTPTRLEPTVEASSLASSISATAGDSVAESTTALATGVATTPMNTPLNKSGNADQDQELHGFLNAEDPSAFSFIPPTPNIVNETIKEMESIRRRFHHNILKSHNSDTRGGKNRLGGGMDDNVQREYSQFETEDEDDDDDIFMEPEYSIGGDESVNEQSGSIEATAEADGERNGDDDEENAEGEEAFDGAKECNSSDDEEDLRTEEHLLANLYQQLGMRLPETDYKPQVLKTLYKGRRYETKLRELDELCGKAYQQALEKLHKVHCHYSRPSIVLELEEEEFCYAEPSSSLLTFGRNIVCNFNLEAYMRAPHKRSSARDTPLSSFSSSPYVTRRSSISSPTMKDVGESTSDGSSGASSYDSPAQLTPPTDQPLLSPEPFDEAILTRKLMGLDGTNVAPHVLVCPPERGTPPALAGSTPDRKKPPKNKLNLETFASTLWDCSTVNAGMGVTKLMRYNFVRHLVYSLLKGRPVIVYGTPQNENLVRELVSACSLFVPGSGRGANALIASWRTKPIHMSDLAYLKLIGLSKRVTIPKAVERYVSIFDYENAQLRCPPYTKGTLVEKILGLRTHWPDEKTHLAYIHYKLLEVATQACLYYQMCCVTNNFNHTFPPASSVPGSLRGNIQQTYSADVTVSLREKSGSVSGPASSSALSAGIGKGRSDSSSRENSKLSGASSGGGMGDDGGRERSQLQQDEEGHEPATQKRTSTLGGYPGYQANPERLAAGAPGPQSRANAKPSVADGGSGKGSMYQRTYHSEGQLPTVNVPTVPSSVREQAKLNFFRQTKVKTHDMAIVEYFAEVVKEQQSLEMHGPGAQVAPVIHLDYTPCALFKHAKEKGKGSK